MIINTFEKYPADGTVFLNIWKKLIEQQLIRPANFFSLQKGGDALKIEQGSDDQVW